MPVVSLVLPRAARRTLLPAVLLAAVVSCGKGGDVMGPPNDPPDDPPGGAAVESVELAPGSVNVGLGQSAQLTATPRAAGGSALADRTTAWATSDAAIATVSGTGLVTAVALGDVTITATSEGKTGSAAVTVSNVPVAALSVTPNPSSVGVGRTAQLTAVPKAADGDELIGRPVTWSTSDPAVATVSNTGLVTGVALGTATITGTSEGKSDFSVLTVSAIPVATVEVAPATVAVREGASAQLTATAKDENGATLAGRPATWSTSNPDIARVNAAGRVTGVAAGTATITASIEGKQGTATVTVMPATGQVRVWQGGAAGRPSDWSTEGNWNPAGKPITLDTVRVPAGANSAVLSQDVQVARLIVAGGRVRTAGKRLKLRVSGN